MGLPLDSISSEENRVGAPSLRPLPLETRYGPLPRVIKQCRSDLTNRAEEVMGRNGLYDVYIDFLYRQIPNEPETAALTLFIYPIHGKYDKTIWENSVRSLKVLVDEYFAARGHRDLNLCVELIDFSLVEGIHWWLIVDNPPLRDAWKDYLVDSIISLLDDRGLRRWDIDLCRLGYSKDVARNPVLVYVQLDLHETDMTQVYVATKLIREYLESVGWGELRVHVERGLGWSDIID